MKNDLNKIKQINIEKENQVRTLMEKLTKITSDNRQQEIDYNMLQTKYITETDKLKLENERLNSNDIISDLNKINSELEKKIKLANDDVEQLASKQIELQNDIQELTKQNKD